MKILVIDVALRFNLLFRKTECEFYSKRYPLAYPLPALQAPPMRHIAAAVRGMGAGVE